MATKHVICNLNLNGNQIEKAVAEVLASAPSNPGTGQFYYDSTKGSLGYFNGTAWVYPGGGNVYDIDTLDDASATEQFKLYYGDIDGTEGTSIKTTFKFRALKSDGTNIKLEQKTSGTGSSAKEYIEISLNDIAISKVTGLQDALDAKLDDSQLSTSATLIETGETLASDSLIPSQKAVKSYVDAAINGVEADITGAMHFIGTWDGTKTIAQNVATTGQAITKLRKGDYWLVDTACAHGDIPSGGIESATGDQGLSVGDMVIAVADVNTASSATADNFKVIDNTESADLVRLNSTQTLTNKTISGSSNTFSNIPESAVTNLTDDLAAKVAKTSITTANSLNADTTTNKTTVPSDYTVGKAIEALNSNAVHQYKDVVTTGTTKSITAATHDCGKYPEVKVYQKRISGNVTSFNEVCAEVSINASGDVTVSWNGQATTDTSLTIVIIGSKELE